MRQEKNILHGIEFTDIGENRSRCEFCHKTVHNLLLNPHSQIHIKSIPSGYLPNDSPNQSIENTPIISRKPQVTEPITIQNLNKVQKPEKLKLKIVIKYFAMARGYINKLNKVFARTAYIKTLKAFRKWVKDKKA